MQFSAEDGYALGMPVFTPFQAKIIANTRRILGFPEVKLNVEDEPRC